MKAWTVNYEGNEIRVENRWDSERLFVNDQLQDERTGITLYPIYARTSSRLLGKLPNEKQIKVSLGSGFTKIHCTIFVDNQLVLKE